MFTNALFNGHLGQITSGKCHVRVVIFLWPLNFDLAVKSYFLNEL